jgi:Fungal specific transcription factor domain
VSVNSYSPVFVDFSFNQDDMDLLQLSPPAYLDKPVQFVSPILNSSFLWNLACPKEPTAVGFLIKHHGTRRRHEDSQRGFMELLGIAYEQSKPSSLLHQATYALSLSALSNSQQSMSLRMEARREYGKALKQLSHVIKNPKLATTDETLMTILVFSLCEVRVVSI